MRGAKPSLHRGWHRRRPRTYRLIRRPACRGDDINPIGETTMNKLSLDVDTLAVESLEAGAPDQDCPAASATAAARPV
jgi:hypothetical protein